MGSIHRNYFEFGPANLSRDAGLKNSTCLLVFTSAIGCRASENFDISSLN